MRAWLTMLTVSCAAWCVTPVCADDERLEAVARCEQALAPGRVLCEVSAKARSGRLVWSDVLVVRAPEFARPLRSRVVAALSNNPELATAKLALVAAQVGQGTLSLSVRGVICQAGNTAQRCEAVAQPLVVTLHVGPLISPSP